MRRIVTLTTDFGLEDHFVGVMKGVILSRAPDVSLVDLCHHIPAQDVFRACWLLRSAVSYFSNETIHLVVVDPGVGTARRVLYLYARGSHFLAPDNGVLSFLKQDEITSIRDVSLFRRVVLPGAPDDYRYPYHASLERLPQEISHTFHGRDLFAPLAGYLASGGDPSTLGPPISFAEIKQLDLPDVAEKEGILVGQIVYIDHFGNLISNVEQRWLSDIHQIEISIAGHVIYGLVPSYGWGETGQLLALINSDGYLEIAQNKGNSARLLSAKVGTPLHIRNMH